jgi:hypothetical protein
LTADAFAAKSLAMAPSRARPLVDVVVPAWNGGRLLERCLDSLAAQSWRPTRVVVVDNGSTDGSLQELRRRAANGSIVLLEVGFNSGFSAAVNRGIEASDGEYVALLNQDAIADPDWIERLVTALEADVSLGSAASRMLWSSDPATINGVGLAFAPLLDACSRVIGWGEPDSIEHHRPCLVLAASGGAAMYRRRALREVGPFDDDYFLYYEDFDIGLRLQLAGWDCLYVPEARVLHDDEALARRHPDWILRLNRRNSRWTILKCLPSALLAAMLARDLGGSRRALFAREPPLGHEVPAAARRPPCASLAEKRRRVQRTVRVSSLHLARVLGQARRPYLRRGPAPRHAVALVSHSRDLAGAELCLLRLAEGLRANGESPVVLVPGAGPLSSALRKADVEVALLSRNAWWTISRGTPPKVALSMLLDIPRSTYETYRVLRECGARVVGTASSVVPNGAFAAKLAGIPHVWHVRELYPSEILKPALGVGPTLRAIERLSRAVVAPSARVGALFDGSPRLEVSPEGIDRRFFDAPRATREAARREVGLAGGGALVLVAGTLESSKNQLDAVRVLARLRARGHDVRLLCCGNEPDAAYRAQVRDEAQQLGVAAHVTLRGFQPDLRPYFDAADLVLVPSRRDAFGLTVVEAMARGVPVIATRCGGPEELVDDGVTGFLVPIDDVDAMAARAAELLADPARARALGDAGRARAHRYHPDENLRRALATYGVDHPQR